MSLQFRYGDVSFNQAGARLGRNKIPSEVCRKSLRCGEEQRANQRHLCLLHKREGRQLPLLMCSKLSSFPDLMFTGAPMYGIPVQWQVLPLPPNRRKRILKKLTWRGEVSQTINLSQHRLLRKVFDFLLLLFTSMIRFVSVKFFSLLSFLSSGLGDFFRFSSQLRSLIWLFSVASFLLSSIDLARSS